MARQGVCFTRRFDFSTAFTVDLLKHLWDQDWNLVSDELSNSQLFSSAYIFNSQNWISTRILRVCKHEFRALAWTCLVSGLLSSNTPRYFSFALYVRHFQYHGIFWQGAIRTFKGTIVLLKYRVADTILMTSFLESTLIFHEAAWVLDC